MSEPTTSAGRAEGYDSTDYQHPYRDEQGVVCPHYDDAGAISRAAVLDLIRGDSPK